MTKTTLLEDKRLIRLVCASLLGMQLAVVLLMLSFAYPFMTTMNEIARQFPQIMESIKKNKDGNLVSLEKDMQAIKSSFEEVKGSMKKMDVMPITMSNIHEELTNTNKEITWVIDNMTNMRRKTEKYLTAMPLMENSITHLHKELSTINLEMRKIQSKLPNTYEPLSCLFTTFDRRVPPFKGYTYQGETFILPSKDSVK